MVEVPVMGAVLGVLLLVAGQTGASVTKNYMAAKKLTSGVLLAQQWMEEKKRLDYNDAFFATSTGSDTPLVSPGFQRTWTIANNAPTAGKRTLSVAVSWDGGRKSTTLKGMMVQ